ncbi:MAG: LPS export ABC transporter periplasmic protein LptC [Geminicoccaceae bacterium]
MNASLSQPRLLRASKAYSRFVGSMRILLPLAALALIAVLIFWSRLPGLSGGFILPSVDDISISSEEGMKMENPHYVGETDKAEPYEVTADVAVIDPQQPDLIELRIAEAKVDRTGRDWRLTAGRAFYDRERKRLDMDEGIELSSSDGYLFEAQAADVELEEGRLTGRSPISGGGPAGTLQADRFAMDSKQDLMRFSGNVRVKLYTKREPTP